MASESEIVFRNHDNPVLDINMKIERLHQKEENVEWHRPSKQFPSIFFPAIFLLPFAGKK